MNVFHCIAIFIIVVYSDFIYVIIVYSISFIHVIAFVHVFMLDIGEHFVL
jgi:hypothetical protein